MRVLVNRRGAIGDVLWTEPVVSDLLALGHEVSMTTRYPEILLNIPGLTFNNNKFDAEAVIDLDMAYERTPQRHVLISYYEVASKTIPMDYSLRYPRIYFSADEKRLINGMNDDPYVLFHLKYKHYRNYRRINGVNWNAVADYLRHRYGIRSIQLYGDGELDAPTVQTPTIRHTVPWIYRAKMFIAVNSGPEQIASSLGIPSVICYGSVNPKYWHFPTFTGKTISGPCEFAGCYSSIVSTTGAECRLPGIGKTGIPKCTVQSVASVCAAIDEVWKAQIGGTRA